MIHKQIKLWFQQYLAGRLRTPQALYAAAQYDEPDRAKGSDRFFDVPVDGAKWEALERLRAPGFMRTNAFLAQWDLVDWQHVDPRLMMWAAMLIEQARLWGIPLYVHSAFRTEAEQADMILRKVSRTPYPRSAHNIGEAVDIVHGVFHWNMSPREWQALHVLGLRCLDRLNAGVKAADRLQLTWGGHFTSLYDPAHWEIADYRMRIKRLPVGPPVRRTPRDILRNDLGLRS